MQLWHRTLITLIVGLVVGLIVGTGISPLAHADDLDVSRWATDEIAHRRAAVRDFYSLRVAASDDEERRERWAEERRRARLIEEERMERARIEYVQLRPPQPTPEEEERRERLALAELERAEQRAELHRQAYVRLRSRMQAALASDQVINEMLEYDLNTERINRTSRDGQ
ncbi:MAG: hypothetical protein NDI61_12925 [Bdellovibrionaceae bacterium]|nr:hypothetical protein [Pseudobdellovibrionaceae bacterium]